MEQMPLYSQGRIDEQPLAAQMGAGSIGQSNQNAVNYRADMQGMHLPTQDLLQALLSGNLMNNLGNIAHNVSLDAAAKANQPPLGTQVP